MPIYAHNTPRTLLLATRLTLPLLAVGLCYLRLSFFVVGGNDYLGWLTHRVLVK